MHLRFSRACPNRAPCNQIRDILRRDHIQVFSGRRHSKLVDAQQQLARQPQAIINSIRLIHVWVIDQPLPTHSRAGFLKIHPHDNFNPIGKAITHHSQSLCIFDGSLRVMNAARPDHYKHAIIVVVQYIVDCLTRIVNNLGHAIGYRKFADQMRRRSQLFDFFDTHIISSIGHIYSSSFKSRF